MKAVVSFKTVPTYLPNYNVPNKNIFFQA